VIVILPFYYWKYLPRLDLVLEITTAKVVIVSKYENTSYV